MVVEWVTVQENGKIPNGWDEEWGGARKRINRKLREQGWELYRHDGIAKLRKYSPAQKKRIFR